jgi:hypothetical protein
MLEIEMRAEMGIGGISKERPDLPPPTFSPSPIEEETIRDSLNAHMKAGS